MSLKDTIKKRPMTAAEIEKAAEAIHQQQGQQQPAQEAPPRPRETAKPAPMPTEEKTKHRLTIDLPAWLVVAMKSDIELTGQTLKGVVLQLLLEKYRK